MNQVQYLLHSLVISTALLLVAFLRIGQGQRAHLLSPNSVPQRLADLVVLVAHDVVAAQGRVQLVIIDIHPRAAFRLVW